MNVCSPARAVALLMGACLCVSLASEATVAQADTTGMSPVAVTPSSEAYHRGLADAATGDLSKAAQAFEQSIRLDPKHVEAYLGLAELAFRKKQPANAEKHLKQALSLAPENARVHRAWGRYLVEMKDYAKAEAAFARAVSLDPRFTDAQMDLGTVRATALKQPQGAIDAYRAAVASNPTWWQAHYALALQLEHVGRQAEAHKAFQQARRLTPSNHMPSFSEGRLYVTEGKPTEALAAFDEAVKADPKFVPAVLARADVQRLSKHNCEEALVNYRAVLTLAPNHAQAHVGVGLCLEEAGQSAEATEHFNQAAKLSPKDPTLWHELGQLYGRRKKYADAVKAFDAALTVNQKFVPAMTGRADIYLAQGLYGMAQTGYSAALALAPKSSALQIKLGIASLRQRRWAQAEELFQQALTGNPKAADAWNNLAWMAVERNQDLDDAVEWGRKAIDLQPKNAGYHDTLGWVYRARGELTRAAAQFRKAVELDPKDPVIQYHLGLVYAEQESPEKAKAAFRNALSLQQDFEGFEDARKRLSDLDRGTPG
ncbi:MAG: tetratricopeptide repeat protein [Nitrospira sp.]|nr:MAG: tetratricopeptide repeat protein [Nitrospira sp.]